MDLLCNACASVSTYPDPAAVAKLEVRVKKISGITQHAITCACGNVIYRDVELNGVREQVVPVPFDGAKVEVVAIGPGGMPVARAPAPKEV
jgi:hypothetical protein